MTKDEVKVKEVIGVLDKSPCTCMERGKDGTDNHDNPSGVLFLHHKYEFMPCSNHLQNYIRTGWVTLLNYVEDTLPSETLSNG